MNKKIAFVIFLIGMISSVQSQELKKENSFNVIDALDSLLIDHELKNYSLRVFTNYKAKQFKIKDDDAKLKYLPTNKYGIGVGFANSKMVVDIAFNIKNGKEEATDRFDLQGTTIIGKHNFVNLYIQTYKGFNVKNDFGQPTEFRSDIKSVTIGFNYLYTLLDIEFSYALLKAGLAKRNKKVYVTGGLGTFAVFDYFSANNTILPESSSAFYNSQAQIKRYNSAAIGVLGGLLSVFMLPEDLIFSCNLMPGIALMNKRVTLQNDHYRPSNPMLYKLDFTLTLGYNIKRYYVNLLYGNSIYSTDLDFDNKYLFNLSNAKLTIGYRLKG